MKKRFLLMVVVATFLLVATAVAVSAAKSNRVTSQIYTFGLEPVQGARAHLMTNEEQVRLKIDTHDLMPGDATTIWWVVFNNPAACSNGIPGISNCSEPDLFNPEVQGEVSYADGQVIGHKGTGRYFAQLYQGVVPRGWFGNGLLYPTSAEIHMVVRTHGQAIDGRINEMIMTFAGACSNVPPAHPGYGDGTPGPNECEDIQFAVFQQ